MIEKDTGILHPAKVRETTLVLFANKVKAFRENRFVAYFSPIVALVLIYALFAILTGGIFLNANSLRSISKAALPLAIVATGGVLIYSSGNMNIAMGGSTGIAAAIGGIVYIQTGSWPLMLLTAIGTGIIVMAICILLNKIFRLGIIVITIIAMTLLSSLLETLVPTGISLPSAGLTVVNETNLPLILGIIFFVIIIVVFEFTKVGRTLKFIGDNEKTAEQTGININKWVIISFVVSGIAVGLAAFANLSQYKVVTKMTGLDINMNVILALVIAGTPLNGGNKSKVYSGVVGAFLISGLNSGLSMVRVDSIWIQCVKGILLLIIVFLSVKRPKVLPVKEMM